MTGLFSQSEGAFLFSSTYSTKDFHTGMPTKIRGKISNTSRWQQHDIVFNSAAIQEKRRSDFDLTYTYVSRTQRSSGRYRALFVEKMIYRQYIVLYIVYTILEHPVGVN